MARTRSASSPQRRRASRTASLGVIAAELRVATRSAATQLQTVLTRERAARPLWLRCVAEACARVKVEARLEHVVAARGGARHDAHGTAQSTRGGQCAGLHSLRQTTPVPHWRQPEH